MKKSLMDILLINRSKYSLGRFIGITFFVVTLITIPMWAQKSNSTALTKDFLLGKIKSAHNKQFVRAMPKHQVYKRVMYIDRDTYLAFQRMAVVAKKDGISLAIVSAARDFDYQKILWENKWTGKSKVEGKNLAKMEDELKRALFILRYSAMPGTSRHHWGTDIDLNSVYDSYFATKAGKKVYAWLMKNAPHYGFCQTYTKKSLHGRTGYEEEKWHWSYLPKSRAYLQAYNQIISAKDISGFAGDKTVESLGVIKDFVNGINPACK